MKRLQFRNATVRVALVGIALGGVLLASTAQVGDAISAAVCSESAKYLLISCRAGPDLGLMIATGAMAVGLAILLGSLLGALLRDRVGRA